MTTWLHYPYSHPWMPTLKRKLSDDDSEADSSSSQMSSSSSQCSIPRTYHSPKRRRYDLSRNLSRLSLFERIYPIVEEPQQPISAAHVPQSWTMRDGGYEEMPSHVDTDVYIPVKFDAIVEEPVEPAEPINLVREVRMRSSSSYEPEKDRIVVTDLDSSESESEQEETNPFAVSSAVLTKLTATERTLILKPAPTAGIDTSRAMVLYRPSPWTASDSQGSHAAPHTDGIPPVYEDAMEIE